MSDQTEIVVIGDLMIDESLYGNAIKLSPEAPIPVLQSTRSIKTPGGAGNLAANLAALLPEAIITVYGALGSHDKSCYESAGINTSLCQYIPQSNTKFRCIDTATGYQIVRVDNEQQINIQQHQANTEDIMAYLERRRDTVKAVLVSDYDKGFVTDDLLGKLTLWMPRTVVIGLDTRRPNIHNLMGIDYIVPNYREYQQLVDELQELEEDISNDLDVAKHLFNRWGLRKGILRTESEAGMTLVYETGESSYGATVRVLHEPAISNQVVDVTGAGDTAFATFIVSILAIPSDPALALSLASKAAGIVCGMSGTSVPCTFAQMLKYGGCS